MSAQKYDGMLSNMDDSRVSRFLLLDSGIEGSSAFP